MLPPDSRARGATRPPRSRWAGARHSAPAPSTFCIRKLVLLFANVICIFADNCVGLEKVADLLKLWVSIGTGTSGRGSWRQCLATNQARPTISSRPPVQIASLGTKGRGPLLILHQTCQARWRSCTTASTISPATGDNSQRGCSSEKSPRRAPSIVFGNSPAFFLQYCP